MEDSLSLDTYWIIRDTHHCLKKDLQDRLADNGITWPQFHALCHIEESGIPANELARELNCNASNMTGLVDRMIESKWVYREHSEKDRRVWQVKLTAEGIGLRARLIPQHHKNIEKLMSVLNEQELVTLKALLVKLISGEMEKQS